MARWFQKSKSSGCGVCRVLTLVIGLVALLGSIAAIIGVYKSHMLPEGLVFGTSQGSIALTACALNLFLLEKARQYCPCTCEMPKKK